MASAATHELDEMLGDRAGSAKDEELSDFWRRKESELGSDPSGFLSFTAAAEQYLGRTESQGASRLRIRSYFSRDC